MSASEKLRELGIHLAHSRPGEQRLPCPSPVCAQHRSNERKPPLAVKVDDDGNGATWHCHRCGWAGGVGRAAQAVSVLPRQKAVARSKPANNFALQLWDEASPIECTPGEHYLRRVRGVSGALPSCLRYHPHCPRGKGERLPAMMGLFVDIDTSAPMAVHRTFLKPDGSGKVEHGEAKMWLGSARGSAIKLTPDDEVEQGLGICEGIETGLSLLHAGYPVWVLGAAGGIKRFPVLPGIECLTIFADNDQVGIAAAQECAGRWAEAGQEARILSPSSEGDDWNDIARAA